ncbi:MAG: T9SS type A sorting domain-containing protein [Flavobacteriales bacterium]|nr:T9SS type A sorting domain-containing protein [Flavobacteriales bacterium]
MRHAIGFLLVCAASTLLPFFIYAQNLVPNGGFEEYTVDCTFGIGFYGLADWRYLNCGNSPGLAHACNNTTGNGGGVPQSGLGYQYAHDGDGFIMTEPYFSNAQSGLPDANPQTYANVDLVQSLTAGQRYCLRLWMNMADSSCYRTDTFHAYVGYGIPTLCNYADTAWDTYATATWDISMVDTIEWTLLESEFIANSGETNLTLGAFQFDDEINSVFLADHSSLFGALVAAYYIDDVELWACQVGVEEVGRNNALALFPDPADQQVTMSYSGVDVMGAALSNAVGQDVTPKSWGATTLLPDRQTLDVSSLPAGAYFLSVRTKDGNLLSRRLVIQH